MFPTHCIAIAIYNPTLQFISKVSEIKQLSHLNRWLTIISLKIVHLLCIWSAIVTNTPDTRYIQSHIVKPGNASAGRSASSFPFSSLTINYICQGSKICYISHLIPRLTFTSYCRVACSRKPGRKITKSNNVPPEPFRCKSDIHPE